MSDTVHYGSDVEIKLVDGENWDSKPRRSDLIVLRESCIDGDVYSDTLQRFLSIEAIGEWYGYDSLPYRFALFAEYHPIIGYSPGNPWWVMVVSDAIEERDEAIEILADEFDSSLLQAFICLEGSGSERAVNEDAQWIASLRKQYVFASSVTYLDGFEWSDGLPEDIVEYE